MNHLFEREFLEISNGIAKDIKEIGQDWKFSILGTPLISSKILLVGNNWGGTGAGDSQCIMPLCNDILAYPTVSTYKGYLDFFLNLFDEDKHTTINFFNGIVYANGNFIRTPNEHTEYNQMLDLGHEISNKYLRKIIELIEPVVIICFGNSNRSGTSAVSKALELEKEFWNQEDIIAHKTSNNWYTYHFTGRLNSSEFDIFSFPHSSKYNYWKKNIEQNPNFVNLKNLVNNVTT